MESLAQTRTPALITPALPMQPAQIPANEKERLAALYSLHVLDTPTEERFDRIARLATRMFRAPIAYVALVDQDRQWFKAKCGLPLIQTDRDVSMCGHTILGHEPLIVPDTLLDHRFCDNPLVIGEPHARFYAGHPVAGPNGQNVGTLCIIDRSPRTFDDGDRRALADLARLVERELGLVDTIRLQSDLIQARERLVRELDQASQYVKALLPEPIDGDICAEWCFQPSSELGGDAFGYHWLDENRFVAYLLDVSGHGVGTALLSASVLTTLRNGSLTGVDFGDPSSVLDGLNRSFEMGRHGYLYFTIWYGVYDRRDRRLTFATAGHPPAVMVAPDHPARLLGVAGSLIGVDRESTFGSESTEVPCGSSVYLYTDGAYEIERDDGTMGNLQEWVIELTKVARLDNSPGLPDRAYRRALKRHGMERLADDFALLRFQFS